MPGLGGGEVFVIVADDGSSLQREVDDQVGRRMRSVSGEQLRYQDPASEIVVALILATPVWVVHNVERLHPVLSGVSADP